MIRINNFLSKNEKEGGLRILFAPKREVKGRPDYQKSVSIRIILLKSPEQNSL